MDLGTSITGAILVACCIVPFIAIGRSIKRKKTKMVQSLNRIALQNNVQISEQEFCGSIGIAISEKDNALLYFKGSKDKETNHFIKLNDIQQCNINKVSRTISSKSGKYQVIDKLELCFTFKKNNTPEMALEFYNTDDNVQLDGELQLMERWAQSIQMKLKTIQDSYRLSAAS